MAKNEEEVNNTPFGFGTSSDAYASISPIKVT